MFKGKTALVTGSTSGIGLGIASAFAEQGANVIVNGFGEPSAIEQLRAKLSADHGVTVRYDGADLSQQAPIEAMMGKGGRIRRDRHPRQQRRHPACRADRRIPG